MKKTLLILTAAGALALTVPAFADDATPAAPPSASKQCKTERTQMGRDAFALLYGTNKNRRNAFGKCVSKRSNATAAAKAQAKPNAAQDCKAEQAADPAAFATKYGTNANKQNAYGKCVSQKANAKAAQTVDQQVSADVDAAKACKAQRKRKAFRTCVASQTATS
jgi:hypothetical protein